MSPPTWRRSPRPRQGCCAAPRGRSPRWTACADRSTRPWPRGRGRSTSPCARCPGSGRCSATSPRLAADLRPGAAALRRSAGDLAAATEAGAPGLRRSQALSARLEPTFRRLDRFAADGRTPVGLRALTGTVDALDPLVAHVTPAQTTCNLVGLLLRNAVSLLSEGGATGTWQRFIILATPQGENNEGGSSARPANGPELDNFLHSNPYPHTAAPGQPRECEAGNEPYAAGRQAIGNVPGRQGGTAVVKGDGR